MVGGIELAQGSHQASLLLLALGNLELQHGLRLAQLLLLLGCPDQQAGLQQVTMIML